MARRARHRVDLLSIQFAGRRRSFTRGTPDRTTGSCPPVKPSGSGPPLSGTPRFRSRRRIQPALLSSPTATSPAVPSLRPLASATAVTSVAAALALILSGGHSPLADRPAATAAADGQVARVEAAAPADATALPAPSQGSDNPDTTAGPGSATPGVRQVPGTLAAATPDPAAGRSTAVRTGAAPGATPRPTSKPTPRPATGPDPQPTAAPTLDPTAAPTPRPSGTLSVSVDAGTPVLSWSAATASSFAAYAVVRSLDSEIHFPAEDLDTVVAMVTSAGTTRLSDSAAVAGTRVWYRVWALSRSGGEYTQIWASNTVAVTP